MRKTEHTLSALFAIPFIIACLGCIILLFAMSGCSTVSAVGGLLGGMGNDIQDAADGTRARMKERN